jgi:hypothetical protein
MGKLKKKVPVDDIKAYREAEASSTHSYYRYVTEVGGQPQRTASLVQGQRPWKSAMF